jgi:hypothetical protein
MLISKDFLSFLYPLPTYATSLPDVPFPHTPLLIFLLSYFNFPPHRIPFEGQEALIWPSLYGTTGPSSFFKTKSWKFDERRLSKPINR